MKVEPITRITRVPSQIKAPVNSRQHYSNQHFQIDSFNPQVPAIVILSRLLSEMDHV